MTASPTKKQKTTSEIVLTIFPDGSVQRTFTRESTQEQVEETVRRLIGGSETRTLMETADGLTVSINDKIQDYKKELNFIGSNVAWIIAGDLAAPIYVAKGPVVFSKGKKEPLTQNQINIIEQTIVSI